MQGEFTGNESSNAISQRDGRTAFSRGELSGGRVLPPLNARSRQGESRGNESSPAISQDDRRTAFQGASSPAAA